ncbi:restriction endonuclease subunit S [Leucothrix sargassi]|nr:restriction endonuclease subunit S [Leucothrix sargassi]
MKTVKLDDLSLKVSSGLTPLRSNKEFWDNGTIPWLKTEQLGEKYIFDTSEYVSQTAINKTALKVFPENTLSIAMYGEGKTRGNVSIIKKPMTTNQACCNVELDKEKADYEYVYYFLKTQYEGLRSLSSGVRKNLNSNDIKNYPIRLPENIEEQQKIASVLSTLDEKIALNNQINATLEQMAKMLYDYWFVQFDFPDENGKPYKSSGGEMVYNETLKRDIPKGWDVKKLADWIKTDKSGDWGQEEPKGNYQLEVTCIRGADINPIKNQGIIEAPTRFILEKNANKLLSDFDFVIEISGGSPTQSTGRIASISPSTLCRFDKPLICSNFCKAISLKDNSYFYNFAFLWNQIYENDILFGWEGKTSGIKNLLFDNFVQSYYEPLPPVEIADKFFQKMDVINSQQQTLLKQNAELTKLRDWLLPMLMNGQATVQ